MRGQAVSPRHEPDRSAPDMTGPVPDIARDIYPLIITIDGPAGTGKSSVARELAKRLAMEFLDTGAMYRAATALALDRGIALDDEERVAALTLEAEIHFDWRADPPALMAFAAPYTARLRDPDVNKAVSPVSGLPKLREVLVRRQRLIGQQHPLLVTEGRDQGSVVFPDAGMKFYLDASPRVRAQRRARQTYESPTEAQIDAIEEEIAVRDKLDTERAVGPLIVPEGAQRIDTSDITLADVADLLERAVRRLAAKRSGEP